jgi:uncharacterized spore protein YtfJ
MSVMPLKGAGDGGPGRHCPGADALTVKRVFGEPYEKDGVTIIPAARVQGGAGAGGGEDPQGQSKGSGSGLA